jgi:uncharacterized membrane protein
MTWYEFLMFVHIAAAICWVGAGFLMVVLALRAERHDDEVAIKRILDDNAFLGTRLFIPASLVVFVAGLLLTIDGPWEFSQLWIVIGLIGYASTFVTGAGFLKPRGDRIAEAIERDGGRLTPTTLADTKRLLAIARIDYVTLTLVVFDMAVKPTGDDVGVLIAMAAIWFGALAYSISRHQAVGRPGEATA